MNTLNVAWNLYRSTLKVCFIFALVSAVIAEYFKLYALNAGVGEIIHAYMQSGQIPATLPDAEVLALLGLSSMFITMCVYGLLICIGGEYFKEGVIKPELMKNAFAIFRKRFGLFLLVCILNGFLWFLASFLSIFGFWLVTSFTLILLPTVLLGNVGVWMSFRENFRLLGSNVLYALQLGFIIVAILLIKYVVYALFAAIGDGVSFGINHVVIIFIDAFSLAFIVMVMVAAFYELNAKDDLPIEN
ncbi:hypothetical protein [Fastidiosibacter lacustris]|uniref:hypothetical protein n=1 Tax=Fastidiosibacter lacustris TaxID=2056695 RepID=UPI001300B1DA|nr:hypothetical protein [Fastidiosibacter lacustris]